MLPLVWKLYVVPVLLRLDVDLLPVSAGSENPCDREPEASEKEEADEERLKEDDPDLRDRLDDEADDEDFDDF